MERAVAAARRAFDNTDWARDHEGRKQACGSCRRRSRPNTRIWSELVAEVGCPVTAAPTARSSTCR